MRAYATRQEDAATAAVTRSVPSVEPTPHAAWRAFIERNPRWIATCAVTPASSRPPPTPATAAAATHSVQLGERAKAPRPAPRRAAARAASLGVGRRDPSQPLPALEKM